jgi:hypothetical protein
VILVTGFFLFSVHAQAIDLTGTVKTASTKAAIAGARVSLYGHPDVVAVTDAAGAYHLTSTDVRHFRSVARDIVKTPFFMQNNLFFGIANSGEQATIGLYNLSGRLVATLVDARLCRGNYRINPFSAACAAQVYFVKIKTDDCAAMFKMPFVNKQRRIAGGALVKLNGADVQAVVAKAAATKDTIDVLAAGYKEGIVPITAYTGVNNVELAVQPPSAGMMSLSGEQFQGIVRDTMTVFVQDSNVVDSTLPVKVWSTSDKKGFTLRLKRGRDPYAGAVYQGSVTFSLSKSDSTKKELMVAQADSVYASYTDVAPAATVTKSGQWIGAVPLVHPGPSLYLGIRDLMQITLYDNDLVDSTTEVIAHSSNADTAGIPMTLRKMSPGTYQSDKTGFTLGKSVPYKFLQVADTGNGDKIVFTYYDIQTKKTVSDYVVWKGLIGTIDLGVDYDVGFFGTTTPMTVTLKDEDVLIDSAVVHVKSLKDKNGINVTVKGTGNGVFDGLVQFSTTASGAGVIAVQDGDTITVSYNDVAPKGTTFIQAPWHASK